MKRAAWFLPSLLEGSGGHRTILQNASYLASRGEFRCDLYVEDDGSVKNSTELKKVATKFFGEIPGCQFLLGYELKGDYDVYFATAWFTAKVVRDIPSDAPKIYFVQDFEAYFHPMGDGYLMACNSYCCGLTPVTIGRWLTHKMRSEFAAPGQYFDFCADLSVYRPLPDVQRSEAVCFIYQPDKPRRCSTIGIEALGIVKSLRPDVKIYLYGSSQKGHVWFEHTNLGIISIEECNRLYNQCRVGLCISSSNPSRIPFEMMAAGLPVVDVYMENNLYDMPNQAIRLAHYTPESIAEAIIGILDSCDEQAKMSEAGKAFMKNKSLDTGFEQFYTAVMNILNGKIPEQRAEDKMYRAAPLIASAIGEIGDIRAPQISYSSGNAGMIGRLKRIPFLRRNRVVRWAWKKMKFLLR